MAHVAFVGLEAFFAQEGLVVRGIRPSQVLPRKHQVIWC